MITGQYFEVLRIPVLNGRTLNERDSKTGAVVVNQAFARRYFPNADPVGQRVFVAGWREVVGVVADAREESATRPAGPTFYWTIQPGPSVLWLVVRSRAEIRTIEPALRRTIAGLDPELPARITSLQAELDAGRAPTRFYAILLSVFASFALLLAGSGVFALSHYTVHERTHEFGVRLALGAQPIAIGRMVLRGMLWIVLPALVLGELGGVLGSRLLRNFLYGLTVTDPITLTVSAALLVILAMLASFGPARRAASVDPVVTLRRE
jgi:hypothetical protein